MEESPSPLLLSPKLVLHQILSFYGSPSPKNPLRYLKIPYFQS